MRLEKDELYLFGLLSVFAILWVVLITPYIERSDLFLRLNPVLQYVIFNIGFIVFTIVVINLPYRFFTGKKTQPVDMLKVGIAGWLMFSFVFDLWQPPYYISPSGNVLITSNESLPLTAIDAVMTYVWALIVPVNYTFFGFSLLYISVYIITPIIAVVLMMLILRPSLFRKIILER